MWYIISIIIGFILYALIRAIYRNDGWHEVKDQSNQSKTFGKYSDCKSWIEAQKGMDSLIGIRNYYKIKRKKF